MKIDLQDVAKLENHPSFIQGSDFEKILLLWKSLLGELLKVVNAALNMDFDKLDESVLNIYAENYGIPTSLTYKQKVNAVKQEMIGDLNPATVNALIRISTLFFDDPQAFRIEEEAGKVKIFYNPQNLITQNLLFLVNEEEKVYVNEKNQAYVVVKNIDNGFNINLLSRYIAAGVEVEINTLENDVKLLVNHEGKVFVNEKGLGYEVYVRAENKKDILWIQ